MSVGPRGAHVRPGQGQPVPYMDSELLGKRRRLLFVGPALGPRRADATAPPMAGEARARRHNGGTAQRSVWAWGGGLNPRSTADRPGSALDDNHGRRTCARALASCCGTHGVCVCVCVLTT